MANTTSYHSKLVGVSFEGRQDVIADIKQLVDDGNDIDLRFRREPDNEYDKDAVAIDALIPGGAVGFDDNTNVDVSEEWVQVGYIARDKNSELAGVLDAGKKAGIKLSDITGGDGKSYGVNVYIEYEKKRKTVRSETSELVKDIFGNEIFYDDVSHKYTNALGEVYLSGSKYAEQFETEFAKGDISLAMANKAAVVKKAKDLGIEIPENHTANSVLGLIHEVEENYRPAYQEVSATADEIQKMWKLKALASASYGTAIHLALELYGRFKQLAESLGKETHLHDNTVLGQAVTSFYEEHPDVSNARYECLVVDHSKKRAGRIDRIEINEDKSVYITDFKTNSDIKKSLSKYWLQLSFYAAILKANGVKVKGLKIYHYADNKWDTILGDVVDIDKEEA